MIRLRIDFPTLFAEVNDFAVQSVGLADTVLLNWTVPTDSDYTGCTYLVTWSNSSVEDETVSYDQSNLMISGLLSCLNYNFSLQLLCGDLASPTSQAFGSTGAGKYRKYSVRLSQLI